MSQNPVQDRLPWEGVAEQDVALPASPGMVVDLRRCIGCHACSVACKTEHGVPLGTFRMRVRWLPRPDRPTMAFVPVFDGELCDFGTARGRQGLEPACVNACPTRALTFGDMDDPASTVRKVADANDTAPLDAPRASLKEGVRYIGAEDWMGAELRQGARLDPEDRDIIYEQS